MPVNPAKLAKEMIAATEQAPSAVVGMAKLGKAIGAHIVKNSIITFAWTAVDTKIPFLPDPTVIATGKIKACPIILTPSMLPSREATFAMMSMQVTAGAVVAPYMVNSPWVCSPGVLMIKPIKIFVVGQTREDSMLHLATQICVWLTSWIPPIPCVGMRTTYAGVAVPTKIL